MQAVMTDQGLLIPKEWLKSFGQFEIVRESQAIIILPLQSPDVVRQAVSSQTVNARQTAKGKYAFVATSSDEFAARKTLEIELENRA